MLSNCDAIANFLISGQFGVIRKPGSGRIVKLTFSFKVTFYLIKTENRTKKIFNTAVTLLLWVKVLFLPKKRWFFAKKCWHQQNWEGLSTERYIFWNYICMCTYVPNLKFVILASPLSPPPPPPHIFVEVIPSSGSLYLVWDKAPSEIIEQWISWSSTLDH